MPTPNPATIDQQDVLRRKFQMMDAIQDEKEFRQKLKEYNDVLDPLSWRGLVLFNVENSLPILTMLLTYGQVRGYGLPDGGGSDNQHFEMSLYDLISYTGQHRGILWAFAPFLQQAFTAAPARKELFLTRLTEDNKLTYTAFEHVYSQYSTLQQRLNTRDTSFQIQADCHLQSGDLLRTAIVEPEQAVPMADRRGSYIPDSKAQNRKWQVFYVEKLLHHYLSGLAACCAGLQMWKHHPENADDLLRLQWTSKTLLQRVEQLMSQQGTLIQPALADQVPIYTQPVQQALDDCTRSRSTSSDENSYTGMSYYGDTDSEDSTTYLLPATQQVGLFHRRRQQKTPPEHESLNRESQYS